MIPSLLVMIMLGVKNPVDNDIAFSVKVEGVLWEATHLTAVQSDGNAGGSGIDVRQFTVKAENADGEVIQFVLQRNSDEAFGEGSYEVAHVPASLEDYTLTVIYDQGAKQYQSVAGMNTGTITLNRVAGNDVEGTFETTLHDFATGNNISLTEGTFKSDKYGTFY
jgi:hypothetical protein